MLSRQQSAASADCGDALSQGAASTHASTLSSELRDGFEEVAVEDELYVTESEEETETEEAPHGLEEAKAKIRRSLSVLSTVVSGADKPAKFQRALSEVSTEVSTVVSAADEVAKLDRSLSEVSTATLGTLFEDPKAFEEQLQRLRREKAAIDERKATIEMKIRQVSKNLRRLKRGQYPSESTVSSTSDWLRSQRYVD